MTVRLRAKVKAPVSDAAGVSEMRVRKSSKQAIPLSRATVIFQGKKIATPVYERSELAPERFLKGPAVITEYSATTVVPPNKTFAVDRAGNLLINIR